MMKRMTLLAKKEGMSTSDFRAYWAGPHAKLALGMEGVAKYTHNRVDKVLWASGGTPCFELDGIVELYFSDAEAMAKAQASTVGKKFIPADEPLFLKGWTLCVVDVSGSEAESQPTKVLIPFHAKSEARDTLWRALRTAAELSRITVTLNWTVSSAKRELLWSEPAPPHGIICIGFHSVAEAHEAFEPSSKLREAVERHTDDAAGYLIDELRIR